MFHAEPIIRRSPLAIPPDLRARLETARLELLALFRAAISHQSEVTNLLKAIRQHVQQESADELAGLFWARRATRAD
jgi:hypothetical protein